MDTTTAIIVHYETPDLLLDCVDSLRAYYPYLTAVIIDNGSRTSDSVRALHKLSAYPYNEMVYNDSNTGHGPAMHQGILLARTSYVLTLDSDCVVMGSGWLEEMEALLQSHARAYACGRIVPMGPDGRRKAGGAPYCHPATALWDKRVYLQFPPFEHHGSPCLRNQLYAARAGWNVVAYPGIAFPVNEYVSHIGSGTRSRHGAHKCDRSEVRVE